MRRNLLLLLPLLLATAACGGATRRRAPEPPAPPANEQSVKPGINDRFLAPGFEAEEIVPTFEGESREIFVQRAAIADSLHLQPGMTVADVGAGTGLFLSLLAARVAPGGRVFAVDISPEFVAYMKERARHEGLERVEAVLGKDHGVELPEAAADRMLVCDTYHHFEFPRSMLASMRAALRPGGELVVVDFERIPGVSREWILGHVRADKQTVISEIEAAGFHFREEVTIPGLEENYVLRFSRP